MVGPDIEAKGNPIDPVGLFMEAVIVQFTLNKEQNQETAGDSDSQTCDIDEGIGLERGLRTFFSAHRNVSRPSVDNSKDGYIPISKKNNMLKAVFFKCFILFSLL